MLAIAIGIRSKKLQINQMRQEEELSKAVLMERSRVEHITMDAISSICRAPAAKDAYTKKHSDHVAAYSEMIARSLGWDEGRIIGLADAIDAMSSDRVYRKKRSKEFLLEELKREAGGQFDPRLVNVALLLLDDGMIERVDCAVR